MRKPTLGEMLYQPEGSPGDFQAELEREEVKRRIGKHGIVTVWTDGFGSFQARCPGCGWRGKWRRDENTSAADAKQHGAAAQ